MEQEITTEFLISFGHFRKVYSQYRDDIYNRTGGCNKDEINKIVDFWASRGYDRDIVRQEQLALAKQIEEQAAERARSIISLSAASISRSGMTREQAKEQLR